MDERSDFGYQTDSELLAAEMEPEEEWEVCDECGGAGFIADENGVGQCEACGGMGEVLIDD